MINYQKVVNGKKSVGGELGDLFTVIYEELVSRMATDGVVLK